MKIWIYQKHWLPGFLSSFGMQIEAITLYPCIFLASSKEESELTLRHEWIHVRQIREQGWLNFYASYLWAYFRNYVVIQDAEIAYRTIPAEMEAYAEQYTAPFPPDDQVVWK